ncbi:MAG: adenylate/guanylate cyclase domain-containing protein [Acidobacteriota bacterium]
MIRCKSCGFESPPAFRFCGQCGAPLGAETVPQAPTPEPSLGEMTPAEERRHLTLMFCDLVGSTRLSGSIDPEELHLILQRYQRACNDVIEPLEGHIAQYLGDGLLVYFGFPRAHEDDARRAVHAGLRILRALEDLNQRFAQEGRQEISVRIGIDTGDVVTGTVGVGARSEHLALGQTPNRAARIQSLAEPDTVVLSEATYRLVAESFDCTPLGAHTLKGFHQPVELFRAEQVANASPALERFGSFDRLVGRDGEMVALQRAYWRAENGKGQVVYINGDAGIGKSRLVSVLYRQILAKVEPVTCECSPYSSNSAFYPLVSLVVERCRLRSSDTNEEKLGKVKDWLDSLGLDTELRYSFPLIALLLSIPLSDEHFSLPDWSANRIKGRSLSLLLELLRRMGGSGQPAVLIFEDLHWVDPSTEELLAQLIEDIAGQPILLVLTHRPAYQPAWPIAENHTQLDLGRLSDRRARQIIEQVSGDRRLHPSLVQQIIDRTDGVPLYIEETTKMVVESGMDESELHLDSGIRQSPVLSIPKTLQGSLMARLDRLGSAKELAQIGSILGREFSFALIRAVTNLPTSSLQTQLDRLTGAELLHRTGQGTEARYLFKHSLVQEAAYGSLLRRERQRYHALISDILLEHFPDMTDYQPEFVAHHLREARRPERAIELFRRAGSRALERSALTEATGHLRDALDCLEGVDPSTQATRQELAILSTLGAALSNARGFAAPEVEQVYDRALRICGEVGDSPELFWVLWGLRRFHLVRSEISKALELGERLLALADADQSADKVIAARLAIGATLFCLGRPKAALEHLEEGIHVDSPTRDHSFASQASEDSGVACLCWSAWSLWFLGRPREANRRMEEAIALAERIRHSLSLIYALLFATYLAYFQRDFRQTRTRAERLVAMCREHGSWWEALGLMFSGWARLMDPEQVGEEPAIGESEGVKLIHSGIDGYLASGARLLQPQMLSISAEVMLSSNQLDRCGEILDQAIAAVEETGEQVYQAEVFRLCGKLAWRRREEGYQQRSETWYRRALELTRTQDAKALGLRIRVSLAELCARQGRHDEVLELLSDCVESAEDSVASIDLQAAASLLQTARDAAVVR